MTRPPQSDLDIEQGGSGFATIEEGNPELGIDLGRGVPSLPLDTPSQAEAIITDGSNQLFSLYNEAAATHDRMVAKSWESDADSAVLVNGFFSVMLAILLARSYDGLKLNSQAASAFYLSQMYRLSAGLNGTSTPLPFETPTPSTFSPDPSSVRASALWSLSLVISLAGTVIATLLRQWARRYLHLTQEPRGQHNRARIRELTAQGVERLQLQWMSLILPGLFHLSVFLFLYGLFHYSDNDTVDLVVLLSALVYFGLYLFASIASYFPFGSICHTPLSFFAWSWSSRILWLAYKMLYNSSIKLRCIGIRTRLHLFESARAHLGRALRDPGVDMEDLARKCASFLDTSMVLRMFDSLDGHQDMEQFLSTIPGFYNSRWVKRDVPALEKLNGKRLAPAIASFMAYSLTSGVLTEPEKQKRITICLGAINADPLLLQSTFRQSLQTLNSDIFRCIDFIHFALLRLLGDSDPWVKDYAQCVVAVAINRVKPGDDTWIDIVQRYLSPQHSQYQRDGENSIRLCNLMYLTRRLVDSRLRDSDQFEQGGVWRNVLTEVRKFEVTKTAPELQHEFCALWNELAFVAHGGGQASSMAQSNAMHILSIIRTVYLPLHEGTDSGAVAFTPFTDDQDPALRLPSSYPRCTVHRAATGKLPIRSSDPSTSTQSRVTSTPFVGASPYRPPSSRPLPLQHLYPERSGQLPPGPRPTMQQHPSRTSPEETYPRGGSSSAHPIASSDTQEDDEYSVLFAAIDQDNNGQLSAEELQNGLMSGYGGNRFSSQTVKYLMRVFDLDGSGEIGIEEFKFLWDYIKNWRQIFLSFDRIGDGLIDAVGLLNVFKQYDLQVSPLVINFLIHKYGSRHDQNGPLQLELDGFLCACVVVKQISALYDRCGVGRATPMMISRDDFILAVLQLP